MWPEVIEGVRESDEPFSAVRLPGGKYRYITPAHPEFGAQAVLLAQATIAVGTWISANDPIAVPFCLREGGTIAALGWYNGSAAGGNIDVGVYSSAFARLISTGSTAGSGNSAWQWVNVTDTPVPPGRYYLVMAMNNVTANRAQYFNTTAAADLLKLLGVQDSATDAFPLPNPLTNMALAATMTRIPVMGMVLDRSQF